MLALANATGIFHPFDCGLVEEIFTIWTSQQETQMWTFSLITLERTLPSLILCVEDF